MPIPDFQSVMLPLLELAADGQEHTASETIEILAQHFELTDEERREMVPSGQQRRFDNRVTWSRSYMKNAGLLEYPGRGRFQITERGRQALEQKPARIDINFLLQYPEFVEFRNRAHKAKGANSNPTHQQNATIESSQTPEEQLESGYQSLREELSNDILARIMQSPPSFFEQLVVDLIIAMGYGGSREDAGRAIGKSGDNGIDGVIDQDPLGLERVYVQAKRYDSDLGVGESAIREFAGSLGAAKANKGVFVTTSYFTKSAKDFAERHPHKIVLIDGSQLTSLMLRHNVGVRILETLYLRSIDEEFFLND